MQDREPPIFQAPQEKPFVSYKDVAEKPKKSWISIGFMTLLSISLCFLGLILGFIFGDSFGRRNAQYDNPVLREYYAGKCYDYWENQFKLTLNTSLQEQTQVRKDHSQKLDEIFAKMQDMEKALVEYTATSAPPKMGDEKSSVASAAKALAPKKL